MVKFHEGLYEALSLYIRQLAWLNAAPEVKARTKPGETAPDPAPRRKVWDDAGETLPLPDCPDPTLIEWLMEAGPVLAGGYGPIGLTWHEVNEWQRATGLALQPWEARLIVRLSRDFANESIAAVKPHRPAPMAETKPADAHRAAVDQAVRTSMRALIAAQKKGGAKRREKRPRRGV